MCGEPRQFRDPVIHLNLQMGASALQRRR
uniref:Uncharacterized protein n=1 Tax=Anguilla anguilla TaxID=7936 RepID=A0A0E9VU64_ANGAN